MTSRELAAQTLQSAAHAAETYQVIGFPLAETTQQRHIPILHVYAGDKRIPRPPTHSLVTVVRP